jgi:hypothetical protein
MSRLPIKCWSFLVVASRRTVSQGWLDQRTGCGVEPHMTGVLFGSLIWCGKQQADGTHSPHPEP